MTRDVAPLDRRRFLNGLVGCSVAASPLVTPITLAAAPIEARLVVLVLRGGMDGLDVLRPLGDPEFAALRPGLLQGEAGHDLDGFFALHPGLGDLMALWRASELGFVHAVSTPYRDKRSHFEGQDMLEAGLARFGGPGAANSGWLNRLTGLIPGAEARTAFSVGREGALILRGPAPATTWYPNSAPKISSQAERLLDLVLHDDPLFREQGMKMFELAREEPMRSGQTPGHLRIAAYLAAQLRAETRIAAVSINGWDTHGNQSRAIRRPLKVLSQSLLRLKSDLGPVWDRTAVLAMTEFGRTARENGTKGTDHGTGGAMILAGGAIRGGRVYGRWPGLAESDLYDRRDLMPTRDLRAVASEVIAAHLAVPEAALAAQVFPGLVTTDRLGLMG